VFKGGTLKLGKVTIEHPLTMVSTDRRGSHAAESFPSNVGGGVLKRFVVTFDYDNNTMYLKPIGEPIEDLDTFDKSGMWVNAVPEGFKVIGISKAGPAEEAGLQDDDVITAVNDQPATDVSLYEIRKRLRNEVSGTVIRLVVERLGKTKYILLTLRDPI
jgi:predicted metalloprotease with PDZ domain